MTKFASVFSTIFVLTSIMGFAQDALTIDEYSNVSINGELDVQGRLTASTVDLPFPAGYIYGLETSPVTDPGSNPDYDVKISPGACRSYGTGFDGGGFNLILEDSLIKSLNKDWEEGNGGGRFEDVPLLPEKTYHLFLIRREDGYIDAGWDDNIDCTHIKHGYIAYRRIRSYVVDSTSTPAIIQSKQFGDWFAYLSPVTDFDGVLNSTGTITNLYRSPADITHKLEITVFGNPTRNSILWIAPTDVSQIVPNPYAGQLSVPQGLYGENQFALLIPGDQTLQYNETGSGVINFRLSILGYEDFRGRFGGK